MGTRSKTLVVGLLTVGILTGSIFFGFAQKVEAGTSDCLAGILAGKLAGLKAKMKTVASAVGMNVPTNSKAANAKIDANSDIASNTSGQTQGFTVQRCIVEPLVTTMARVALNKFTAQTVKWINSGFKGSPLYVTNPQGFLTDIADQSLGQFINGLGEIGQILCSPFDFQLRLSLNLQYSAPQFYEEIGCRLTDIQQNVQRAFTGGSFGKNGWDNWLQLTAQPQNNPYGAYIKAVNSLDTRIATRQSSQTKQLDWGKGFLSSQRCAEEVMNQSTGEMECLRTEIETPGSLIEDQLSETLGQKVKNVGLAKDIDAIIGALINQMINQVMGGVGGLLGASRPSGGQTPRGGGQPLAGGGQSMVDRGNNATVANILDDINQSQNLPNGLFIRSSAGEIGPTATDETGKPTGPAPATFCTAFKGNIYSADKSTTGGVLTNASLVVVKVGAVGKTPAEINNIPNTPTRKNGTSTQWNLADYNNVVLYCENVQMTAPIGEATRDFNEQTKGEDTPPDLEPPTTVSEVNMALRKPARQSSRWSSNGVYYEAELAVNGYKSANFYTTSITNDASNNWWTVDLGKIETINRVDIYEYPGREFSGCVIILTDMPGSTALTCDEKNAKVFPFTPNSESFARVTTGNSQGRHVWIQQTTPHDNMMLSEVEVYKPTETINNPGGQSLPPIVFSPSEQESKPNVDNYYNLSFRDFLSAFKMTANQAQTGLKARIKLLGIKGDGSVQLPQFSSIFDTGSLKINDTVQIDVEQNSVTFNENFPLYQGQIVDYRVTARIADAPVYTTGMYTSYKMVMEFFKIVGRAEQVIASSTTMFKIQ